MLPPPPQLILASASPRRRELLDQIGVTYRVVVADVDESPRPDEAPEPYVLRVAAAKSAEAARQTTDTGLPVLAADTAVVVDADILGKPDHREPAAAMLRRLSGRSHRVLTGVSVRVGAQHWQALSDTVVYFRALQEAEILAYWQTGEPRDKAGAYAIQGYAALFIERIEGSFSGVVGLPLFETAELLRKAGVDLITDKDLIL